MGYDLNDLHKWRPIGGGLRFPRPEPRNVRIEFLSDEEVKIFVRETAAGEAKPHDHFVGLVRGYEVIRFAVRGPFEVHQGKGGGALLWTPEVETAGAVEVPDAVSFTRLITRKQRNPELELMMHRMSQNMERRLRQVTRDMELANNARRIEIERERAAAENARREEAERAAIIEPSEEDEGEGESAPPAKAAKPKKAVKSAADV